MKRLLQFLFFIISTACCLAFAAQGVSQYFPRPEAQKEYDRGKAAQKIGYASAAIQAFRKAVELDPNYIDAFSELLATARAVQRSAQGSEGQGLTLGDSALRAVRILYTAQAALSPKNAVYQWVLGQLDESQTQAAAERYFRQAIALDADFVKAYQSLASTLVFRGDLAGARESLRKVYEMRPDDPEALAAYAQRVGQTDPGLYRKLTEAFLKQFRGHEGGADLLANMAAYEGDLSARIGMLERLKASYPPSEYEASEWSMRFLFDAYNRSDPLKAFALAQEMSSLMPARSEAGTEWQSFAEYGRSMVVARTMMDRRSYMEAADLLNQAKAPYLVSPDPNTLLQAEATDMAGNAARAYQILVSAMAVEPSDALQSALIRYGAKLKKTPAQVEADVWEFRLKKTKMCKDFELTPHFGTKKVRLSDYRGRMVLLTFWNPGSGTCREELPTLQKILDKYGPQGLAVITVNTQPSDAMASILMNRYSFISLRAPNDEWAWNRYNLNSVPASILIDRQGRALFRPAFWGYDPQHTFDLEIQTMLAREPKN
ncbi:MAG: redoxin domain-containing protein [Acidobacteriia bacterium]|nr:redoxin domain-containing protein [Terriglobia bacterium]